MVDKSFNTSIPTVPVTGGGGQLPQSAQNAIGSRLPTNELGSDSNTVYSAAALANAAATQAAAAAQVNQASQASGAQAVNTGVIAIPSQASQAVGQTQQIAQTQTPANISQTIPQQAPVTQAPVTQAQSAVVNQPIVSQITPAQVVAAQVSPQQAALGQPVAAQAAPQQAPTVLSEDDYYAQGFELLKQSKYEEAASIFEQQILVHPQGDLADDAHYWIAEAMHVSRKLDVAKAHLRTIISDYPQSRRLPDAMLKTAYIEQSQGNQIEARILFQEIVNLHPQSDAAIAAKNQLAAVN